MAIMLLEWVFTSVFLILVVLALRAALGKRMSAGLQYALWAVVLVRLLVPVQLFTSPVAGVWVVTEKRIERNETDFPTVSAAPASTPADGALGLPLNNVASGNVPAPPKVPDAPVVPDAPEPPDLNNPPEWLVNLGWVWLTGSAAVAFVLLLSNLRFYRKLRRERIPLEAVDCPLRVYVAAGLPSPCLFGVVRPTIYVTPEAAADPDMLRHVRAHEHTHYRHGDHIWSLLRCAALAAHWWNPLVWLAAVLSQRDAELACDEGALKRLGDGERAKYGSTLLALVTAKPRPGDLFRCATTMAGDKKSLKERVSRIAKAPKRVLWAVVVAVLVTVLACVCAFGQAEPAEEYGPAASAEPTVSAQPSQEPVTYDEYEWVMSYFVPDVTDVPEDVVWFVRKAVAERYNAYVTYVNGSLPELGVEFDDFRIDSLSGPWFGTARGLNLEVWRMDYSFHTTTPEAAMNLIVGGNEFVEDNWLRPTYPNSNYVIFQVNEAGKLDGLTSVMINDCGPDDSPEAFFESVARKLEQQGLTDPTALTDVDLNRNGVPETLQISMIDGSRGQQLDIWEGDELIFSEEGYYAHAGYNALFLYRDGNGQYYLLRYNPYMGQGWCDYSYELFWLENGEEQVKLEGSLEFDINFHPLMHQSFDPEAIAAFMEEVNVLLNHSVQLINTDDYLLDTFEREGRLYDSVWWLATWEPVFVRDGHKTLKENLRDFQAAMEAEWYAAEPTLFVMNETEENAHVWLRYQDRSTQFDVDYWEWEYQPPEWVEVQVADLNHDGRDEIVFPLVWGHGAGAYIEKLYVFDAETLEQYDTEGLNDAIVNSIETTGDEDWFYLKGPGMPGPVTFNKHAPRDNPDAPVADAIGLGDIIQYEVSDGAVYCWLGCDFSGVLLGYEGYMKVWLDFSLGGSFKCVYSEYGSAQPGSVDLLLY